MTLTDAKVNSEYRITDVKCGELRRRLLDMGFVPDSKIKVIGKAPFGETVLICLRGINIALRENATNSILVEAV